MTPSPSASPSKASFADTSSAVGGHPTLVAFLSNVPPPLTTLLVALSPCISCVRWAFEVTSWKRSYMDSWLVLAGWWALCLLSEFVFRYMLPVVVAAAYVYATYFRRSGSQLLVTEQSLQATVVDLAVIEASLPTPDCPPPLPWPILFRVLAILYLPALILTHIIHLRVLVGIAGTIALTWRAPWAQTLRGSVWRSSWIRWALLKLWIRLSGQKPSANALSATSLSEPSHNGSSIRFLFVVYENQRWWVGLDWTAALLPSERSSWCSATQEPLFPPSAFALPPQSTTFMDDGHGGIVKRTATWAWEEAEWKVIVKPENAGSRRVEKELPVTKEEVVVPSGNRMEKTKQKIKDVGHKLKPSVDGDTGDVEVSHETQEQANVDDGEDYDDSDEPATDPDGWIYGDNQWKAPSNKGGLGKYTRYRRWTRIALLTEVVAPASADEFREFAAKQVERRESSASPERDRLSEMAEEPGTSPRRRMTFASEDGTGAENDGSSDRNGLKHRLKAAIRKSTA